MKRIVILIFLTLFVAFFVAGCSTTLSHDQSVTLDEGLQTYVKFVPRRGEMDVAQIASHDALGVGLMQITGKVSGRIK